MKIELVLLFAVVCMAQEEDYPLTEYPLLQDSFTDMATMRYLDSYLVRQKKKVVSCYATHKEELIRATNIFNKNLANVEKNIPKNIPKADRKVAKFLVNLLKDMCGKLNSYQNAVWLTVEQNSLMKAAEMLWECRRETPKLINRYESNLVNIKDGKSREKFKKSIEEVIAETEKKYKDINDRFEKCVEEKS